MLPFLVPALILIGLPTLYVAVRADEERAGKEFAALAVATAGSSNVSVPSK